MPRFDLDEQVAETGGMPFSAVGLDLLTELEYTLVTIAIDTTLSVRDFKDDLLEMLRQCVIGCQESARAENILIRVVTFNSYEDVKEIHGYRILTTVDPQTDYDELSTGGMTPLNDAAFEVLDASVTYAKTLIKQDYDVNVILFVITDGAENASKRHLASDVADRLGAVAQNEELSGIQTVLVGVNDAACADHLSKFKDETGFDEFVSVGEATPSKLAKLGGAISRSVSSSSQALATGSKASVPLTI